MSPSTPIERQRMEIACETAAMLRAEARALRALSARLREQSVRLRAMAEDEARALKTVGTPSQRYFRLFV
jgi:hypothetical protein